jgi:hypothetical protein
MYMLLQHYNFEQNMGKYIINFAWEGIPLYDLKGNNSWKTYNFRIKVGNVQIVYCL